MKTIIAIWTVVTMLVASSVNSPAPDPEVIEPVKVADIFEEPEPTPEPAIEPRILTEEEVDILEAQELEYAYEMEIVYLAKTVYGEAIGCTETEQAAVIWCILNRVDASRGALGIADVITQPEQFHGYDVSNPVTEEIYDLVVDVLDRWTREKNGETDIGRVLPSDYLFFHGDGVSNYFTKDWRDGIYWDWTLESPYE